MITKSSSSSTWIPSASLTPSPVPADLEAAFAKVRSECELCGAWSTFTGRTEQGSTHRLALLRCPNGDGDFGVWRPEWTPLLDGAVLVRLVGERLCRVAKGTSNEIRRALALPLEPPPLGAIRCEARGGVLSRAAFELWFDPPHYVRDVLETEFGPADELPRTGPGAAHVLAWDVRVLGAPAKVTLFARFTERPWSASAAWSLSFRLDPPGL